MSKFNVAIIFAMLVFVIVAVLMVAGIIPGLGGVMPGGGGGNEVKIVVWGPVSSDVFGGFFTNLNGANRGVFNLAYAQKNPETYESELIEALASGKGPDIFLLSQDLILKHKDKVFLVPFQSFDKRSFKDTFIEESELYLDGENGIVALPLMIDPMILYWNRDLFNDVGIAKPPVFWDEFLVYSQKLTQRDASSNIVQAGAGLGDFQNIDYAEDIISFLILQTGNPVVDAATLRPTLKENRGLVVNPTESAVRFFAEFSDPAKTSYSWNRAMPESKNAFAAGILAMYFGYAGEYKDIASKNPHLNFDVAEIPQIRDGGVKVTFGKMQALAISRFSEHKDAALTALAAILQKDFIGQLSEKSYLPPVRRDLLLEKSSDPIMAVFYLAALKSRAWLEPEPQKVFDIFKTMVDSAITGKRRISDAVSDADAKLSNLLIK